jgi:N-sulfoglucosamine sulfohydrolase
MSGNDRPNVLMFMLHDLGDHLGCYGHQTVESPNVDGLAESGVRLSSYFTAAPECTPSRAGMYTGQFTHQNGLMGLCHRGWEFNTDARHLAQFLAEGGYETHLFGMQHETSQGPERLGYQHAHSQDDKSAGPVCRAAINFLEGEGAKRGPWFANVGFFDVHRAWNEDTDIDPDAIEVPPYLPDNSEVRRDLTHFHQNIKDTDEAIGGVLVAIANSEFADNTVVIFTTDHGCPFPRAKSTYYDPGIRIPLVMYWPGHIDGGQVHDAMLSNLDFMPTILDICGCNIPDSLEGKTFLPVLEGKDTEGHEAVFGALYYDAFYDPMHYVRTRTHKYIRSFAVTPEDAEGANPEVLAEHKTGTWIRADDSDVQRSLAWQSMLGDYDKPPPEELYDLDADPLEQNNLAEEKSDKVVLKEMRGLMKEMMVRSNSPLLDGHVSPDLSRTRNQRG